MSAREQERLRLLADYDVLDTAPDPTLDRIVALAAAACQVPISLIGLVDERREWYKARVGIDAFEVPREETLCTYVVEASAPGVFVIQDARQDDRFAKLPFIKGEPGIVFYAGAPLVVEDGARLGALCVCDTKPRELTSLERQTLETLADVVVRHLQYRRETLKRAIAENRLRATLTSIGDAVITTDATGAVTLVNPVAEQLLGWASVDALHQPVASVLRMKSAGSDISVERFLDRVLREGAIAPLPETTTLLRRGGGEASIEGSASPIASGPDQLVGSILVFRDVTRRRADEEARALLLHRQNEAREAAERATRAIDAFLATVSHELRTPLTAMLGWTRLLRSNQVSDERRDSALETIERNAVAQTRLIGDLLDVSRIISGKMQLDIGRVDLASIITASLDIVKPAASAKDITVEAVLDPSAANVTGDSARLQQVVWNLLANAVKFTPRGGRVMVTLAAAASSVEIEVTDDGRGIDPALVEHVFDRFWQADGSITRTHGGLGLGLSIVKNIVELHGGTVVVESGGAGRGSMFRVRLPVSASSSDVSRRGSEPPRSMRPPSEPGRRLELAGARILVVEDEEDSRDLFTETLRLRGGLVTATGSVPEALEALANASFDVILSDIGLPGEDGYAFIEKLKALPADAGGRTPAVAVTAYARPEDRARTLRAGFVEHVAKPVDPFELVTALARAIGQPPGP